MKSFKEYLEESLLKHIAIELQDKDFIYEKYGLYDGCKELAEFILTKIKENSNKNKIIIKYKDISNIENVIFDILTINLFDSNEITAEYDLDKYPTIDENTKRFDNCYLNIYGLNNRVGSKWKQLKYILEHELTHIYNDYNLQIKSLKSFLDIFQNDEAYLKSKSYIFDNHKNLKQQIKKAIYLLNGYEKNAFIAQLVGQIDDIKKEYLKTHENVNGNLILKEIKHIDIYQGYEDIQYLIELYDKHKLFKRDIQNIEDQWFETTNQKLDIDKIFEIIKKKFIKVKNKIESYIPKKIAESYGIYDISIR